MLKIITRPILPRMNNKPTTDKTEITIGQRLLQAREMIGISQESVAERLCLKVCTVREIEEDSNPHCIDSTFLRGYIRSYAKLVKISEKEILELLHTYSPIKSAVVPPMQSYSRGITKKKRESWLSTLTWFIIFICIAMAGIWWWNGYKVQKQEMRIISTHNLSHPAHAIMPSDQIFSIDQEVVII